MQQYNIDRVVREISKNIDEKIQRIGLMYRIFSRPKDEESLKKKILEKNYSKDGKKLQDLIGVRITLYFYDDVDLVREIFKKSELYINETVDPITDEEFKPERINLILKIPDEYLEEISLAVLDNYPSVDNTFELQLRTVLSEGWHEVEHDLRYKSKEIWNSNIDLSRTLNGVFATLVTSDWTMIQIFEELSYRNYKSSEWDSMLRNKFRIRFKEKKLDEKIVSYFNENGDFSKEIFRLDRNLILKTIYKKKIYIPLTLDTFIYIINFLIIKNNFIENITPLLIKSELE